MLVNNAGVSLTGDFTDLEYADIDWIVGVNLWGVVHGTKEFLPHLIASGDGPVVNLSSLFGLISMPGQSIYNATKYAVRGMSEALREEMLITAIRSASPRCTRAASRPTSSATPRVSAKEDMEATSQLFDKKLARMTPERAAEIIVNGILKNAPGCWSASTPTRCTTSRSCSGPATRTWSRRPPRRSCPRRSPSTSRSGRFRRPASY